MSPITLPDRSDPAAVAVTGNVDAVTAKLFEQHIMHALSRRPPPTQLVLDLSAVTFLAVSGLEVLARANLRARQQGTKVIIHGAEHRAVSRPLQVSGLWGQLLIDLPLAHLSQPR